MDEIHPLSVSEAFDNRTMELLETYYPGFKPTITRNGDFLSFSLPADNESEYSFVLTEFVGERQITAKRVQSPPGEYFWYHQFESADYKDDVSRLTDAFNKKLAIILSHDTRVRQRVGIVWASFRCEYLDAGRWRNLGFSSTCLRWTGLKPPSGSLYKAVYYRGPKGRNPTRS